MEILTDHEEKIICPYNRSHHIRRSRMNTHLVKCKKSYPDAKMVTCEFNINHRIPEPELQYHHEYCPNRKKIEYVVYQEAGTNPDQFPVHNIDVAGEETWDHLSVRSYNPDDYTNNANVLRHVDVQAPSTRKDFRVDERRRLTQISDTTSLPKPGGNQDKKLDARTGATTKRNLPDKPSGVSVVERPPESVDILMERLQIGMNKAYIPK